MAKLDARTTVNTVYTNHELECPFCRERLRIIVGVEVTDLDVRHSSTEGMNAVFSLDFNGKIEGVRIEHSCSGPMVKR